MEKIIKISPAYDRRADGHGIHNATLYMVLKGEKGAVTFSMGTEWYLPETDSWLDHCNSMRQMERKYRPNGNGVSYCSPVPMNEWQKEEDGRDNCDWLGCKCWGDTSFSISDEVVEILVREGSDAVWKWLEDFYNKTFGISR